MIEFEHIKTKFESENLLQQWKDTLSESNLSPSDSEAINLEMHMIWREFADAAETVDAGEELKKAIGNRYIELKSRWFLLNAQLQYQMFLAGVSDENTAYRASLISGLVGFFEQFLTTEEMAVITRFLSDPFREDLEEVMGRLDDLSSAVAGTDSMNEQLDDLYARQEELHSRVGTSDPEAIAEMVTSLEEQLSDLYAEKEAGGGTTPAAPLPATVSAPATLAAAPSSNGDSADLVASLEEQISDLYAQREALQTELGVSNSDDVLQLVASMDEQLRDLYAEMENAVILDGRTITIQGARKMIVRRK